MNKIKQAIAYIYFQIGVNIIGLPDFHVHIRSIESTYTSQVGSKYHR